MKKIIIITAGVLILLIVLFALFTFFKKPDLSKYQSLKDPVISVKPDAKVLEVKFELDSKDLHKAFGLLFKTYFSIKGTPKGAGMQPPAARYENTIDFNIEAEKRNEIFKNIKWKGSASIPVPDSVNVLPKTHSNDGLIAEFSICKYGDVAEILHYGPYENETGTVKKLFAFIEAQGYEINGVHEEVYLIGPGFLFSNPEKYVTIIRYPVKKK